MSQCQYVLIVIIVRSRMKKYNIGVQCSSMGELCGINTYSRRLVKYLNELKEDKNGEEVNVNAYMFAQVPKKGTDIILVQYEPGLIPIVPMGPKDKRFSLKNLLDTTIDPIVIVAHHTLGLESTYNTLDGFIFHDDNQIGEKPWDYTIIPHPALVFPKKDKMEMREKYGLPKDKKILCTAGFIAGTGKKLPISIKHILKGLKEDEFLYLATSFWKGGDMGLKYDIMKEVEDSGKGDQFRIDTDFVTAEKLNEKMQACDLLWTWCAVGPNDIGSQSGIAADMYGSRRKLIVKDSAHYSFIGSQDKVEVGRPEPNEFAKDVLNLLRNGDLEDVQDPTWLSWQEKAKDYLDYCQQVLGD